MGLIAVATLRVSEEDVGVRLINRNSGEIHDLIDDQIKRVLYNEGNIDNIELHSKELKWIKGNRERYPIVHKDTDEVDNRNSVVVLGRHTRVGSNVYFIANYEGRVVTINENDLIEYGKKYIVANCKVVNRGSIEYIASIQGDIKEIPQIEYGYDKSKRVLAVKINYGTINKLCVPNQIKFLYGIEVIPKQKAYDINYLVMPKERVFIKYDDIANKLPNITSIEYDGQEGLNFYSKFSKLEYLKIRKVSGKYWEDGVRIPIKKIDFMEKPVVHGINAFKDCYNLGVSNLFEEGLLVIRREAFSNLEQLVNVTLPRSLRSLDATAFSGCKNIESLKISNNTLNIVSEYSEERELLKDSPNARLYCSNEFPKSILKRHVAPHVDIIRDKPKEVSKDIERKKVKGAVLGVEIKQNDLVDSMRGLVGFLSLVGESLFRKKIEEAIKYLTIGGLTTVIIDHDYMFLKVYFEDLDTGSGLSVELKHTESYSMVMSLQFMNIYLTSADKLRVEGLEDISSGIAGGVGSIGRLVNNTEFVLVPPHRHIRINRSNIEGIIEIEDRLIIKRKDNNDIVVKL